MFFFPLIVNILNSFQIKQKNYFQFSQKIITPPTFWFLQVVQSFQFSIKVKSTGLDINADCDTYLLCDLEQFSKPFRGKQDLPPRASVRIKWDNAFKIALGTPYVIVR